MATWRSLAVLLLTLAAAAPGRAQSYPLIETPQADDCFHYQLNMKLSGHIRVNRDGEALQIPLNATAAQEFDERVLAIGSGLPVKTARHYEKAVAAVTVDKDKSERSVRADRCLIVAHRCKDQLRTYCPSGPLTREELDVVTHLDTLPLTGMLPGKAVAVGETWKLTNPVVQALCGFEALVSQDLTGKLEAVEGDVARISISGSASGIDLGALAKLTLTTVCRYDLKQKRIVSVEWKQKDDREQGPASPSTAVETTTTLTRRFLAEPPTELSDYALPEDNVDEKTDPPEEDLLRLSYTDPKDRYSMLYGREWQMVAQTDEHLTLRLMERGDFVAQVTLTPWDRAEAGKHMSGGQLQDEMENVPDWTPTQKREDGEVPADHEGYWIYRISALGTLAELNVLQNYILVAGPQGDQVVLAFTMRQGVVEKLGTRDQQLANGIEFKKKK
jgi:hypothetical protein